MTTLVVIAKECRPGRVKTRLGAEIGLEAAARLASASLADTLALGRQVLAARRVLAFDGVPPADARDFHVVPQADGDLDERLAAVFDAATGPTLLVGMDTPQLVAADLAAVFPRWPSDADAVLGPAVDGGFWAIGMREPDGDVIRGVAMSRGDTGSAQLARLTASGRRVRLLGPLEDVDTLASARRVAAAAPGTRFARLLARTMEAAA